jgi:plastocyanin
MKPAALIGVSQALLLVSTAGVPSTVWLAPTTAPSTARMAVAKLTGTVGPGFTITLTNGGKIVRSLKPGKYQIKVADKSDMHNFHLKGPGVDKKTSVEGTGTVTWKVTLKKGTYRFQCDVHAATMARHFTVKK